jgi:hypothetical protein
LFCEAVKLDASLSDANLKKNARNTISLLKVVLFKDPSEAQVLYEEVKENFSIQKDLVSIQHSCSTKQMKVVF